MMPNRLIISMLVFVGAFSSSLTADDWPSFRGPQGDGVIDQSLPTEWGTDKNIAWRTEIPGEGWSSPVTAGDRIYLTSAIPIVGTDENQEKQSYTLSDHH